MASDKSPDQFRGLGIPEAKATLADVGSAQLECSVTQAGPRAGQPVPASADVDLVLEATGQQTADSSLTIYTTEAGNPGHGGGAAFGWRNTADNTRELRGRDISTVSGWSLVEAKDATQTAIRDVDCCSLDNGTVIAVAQVQMASGGSPYQVQAWVWSAGAWSAPYVIFQSATNPGALNAADGYYPTVCTDEDGGVYVCHWRIDTVNSLAQVVTHRSTDNGLTFTQISKRALRDSLNITVSAIADGAGGCRPGRLRLGMYGGQALLVGAITRNDATTALGSLSAFVQFASNSMGGQFHTVAQRTIQFPYNGILPLWTSISFSHHSIVIRGGKFHIIWPAIAAEVNNIPVAASTLISSEIGSAFEPLDEQLYSLQTSSRLASGSSTSLSEYFFAIDNTPVLTLEATVYSGTGWANWAVIGGEGSAWVDSDGVIYFVTTSRTDGPDGPEGSDDNYHDDRGACFMLRSSNSYGAKNSGGNTVSYTFSYVGAGEVTKQRARDARIFFGDVANYITGYAGCSNQGRQVLIHQTEAELTTYEQSLGSLWVGGYTTVNTPGRVLEANENERTRYSSTLIPTIRPNDLVNWAETTGGSGTIVTNGSRIQMTAPAAADSAFITYTMPTESNKAFFRVSINNMTGAAPDGPTPRRAIEYKTDTGSANYHFSIRITLTNVYLYDEIPVTPTLLGTIPITGPAINIIGGMYPGASSYNAVCYVQDRGTGSLSVSDKNFGIVAGVSGVITDGGGSSAGASLIVGHKAGYLSATQTTDIRDVCVSCETSESPTIVERINQGFDQWFGRGYPARGDNAWVADDVKITAIDGNAREGETYTIATEYEYPVTNINWAKSPTPRAEWRSVAVSAGSLVPAQKLVWTLGPDATAQGVSLGNSLAYFHFNGCNFTRADLSYYNGSSWVALKTLQIGISFQGKKKGNTLIVDTSGSYDTPFFRENECRGWEVKIDPIGAGDTKYYTITGNTSGVIKPTSSSKKAVFFLDGVQAADPDDTAAVCTLISNRVTYICDLTGIYPNAIKLDITTGITATNDYRIGLANFGRVFCPGRQYSRGRVLAYVPNSPSEISPDGAQTVARRLGPGGINLRISWTDAIDTSNLSSETAADPDYWTYTTTGTPAPIAAVNDAPESMQGISYEIAEGVLPFVYLPRIPRGSATDTLYERRSESILMTATSGVDIESVVGEELETECFRIASFTAREVR